MDYIITGLLGIAGVFLCISLGFIIKAIWQLDKAKKNLDKIKKAYKK